MNNEFNNQNMNQFQNNNMNSQYSNNYNNLNNQGNKNDKWKDIVIAILVIIVFILTALALYFVVTMKDNNLDDNKDNIQEENNDNSNAEDNDKKISGSISLGDCDEDICEYFIKLNGEVKTLKYEIIEGKETYMIPSMNLYLNGKKIHSYKQTGYLSFSIDYVDIFNDLIVLYDYEKIIIFDKNGNVIREFYELEEINGMVPSVTNVPRYEQLRKLSDFSYIPYSIENNKLKIYGTRYVDGGCATINDGIKSSINLTESNIIINNELDKTAPIIAVYEIDYDDLISGKGIKRTKILQTLDDALNIDFNNSGSGNACQFLA